MINSKSLPAAMAFAALATFGLATNGRAQSEQPGVYTFTLTNFRITDTRSLHNDTDFVSIAVAVGKNPPILSISRSQTSPLDSTTRWRFRIRS